MKMINKTTVFLILSFIISFSLAGAFKFIGLEANNRLAFTILGVIYMFIPAICVIIVKKLIYKEKLKTDLLISFKINKWFFVAWLIMPVISFCTVGISLLFTDVTYSAEMSGLIKRYESILTPEQIEQMKTALTTLPVNVVWITLIQGLFAGITINAISSNRRIDDDCFVYFTHSNISIPYH